jgi:hypothetical protein
MKYLLLLLFLICSFKVSLAQYHAIGISEIRSDAISIDGKIDDWYWIPEKYKLHNENLVTPHKGKNIDKSSFEIEMFIGWSYTDNSLYIIATIDDDIRTVTGKGNMSEGYWINDCMQLTISPNDKKGLYFDKTFPVYYSVLQYYIQFPTYDLEAKSTTQIGPDWLKNPNQYVNWATTIEKVDNKKCRTIIEIKLALWDEWHYESPRYSKRHFFIENETLLSTIKFYDLDNDGDNYSGWITWCGNNNWSKVDNLSKFILDPIIY